MRSHTKINYNQIRLILMTKIEGWKFAVLSTNGNLRLKMADFILIFTYPFYCWFFYSFMCKNKKINFNQFPLILISIIEVSMFAVIYLITQGYLMETVVTHLLYRMIWLSSNSFLVSKHFAHRCTVYSKYCWSPSS